MGALMLAAIVAALTLGVVAGGVAAAFYFVAAFVVQWGYGALCEWRFDGQTLGKRVVGIRVMRAEGTRITLAQAAVRNLVRIVDILPALYLVGGVSALDRLERPATRRFRGRARSWCASDDRRGPRAWSRRWSATTRSSRIPAVIHATSRITAIERDAMIALALRREQLPLAVRYALFAKLADHFEQRLHLPRPRTSRRSATCSTSRRPRSRAATTRRRAGESYGNAGDRTN